MEQVGTVTMDHKGHVLKVQLMHSTTNTNQATGELENDHKTPATIYHMLQDAAAAIRVSGKSDSFKRLTGFLELLVLALIDTVSFGQHVYVTTISREGIHIVKKKQE